MTVLSNLTGEDNASLLLLARNWLSPSSVVMGLSIACLNCMARWSSCSRARMVLFLSCETESLGFDGEIAVSLLFEPDHDLSNSSLSS